MSENYRRASSLLLYHFLGLFALLTCFSSARATIRDGGIDPANIGKGDYIYFMNAATNKLGGNVPSVTSTTTLMQYYKSVGVRYIMVKAATGDKLFNGSYASPQFTSNLCNIAHSNGILIFGYNRSDGSNVVGEIAVADYVFNQGADGFVFDAEVEWEPGATHPWITNASAQAWALCSAVRSNWPTKFLAHSPLPIIYLHSSFPYKEFGYWCDAVLPQVYHFNPTNWTGLKASMSASINWSDVNWKSWQNSLVGTSSTINGQTIFWTNAIKPLALVNDVYGPLYSSPTPDRDVLEFIDYTQADPNSVTAGGYKGVNFWRADLHGSTQFAYIKAGTSGNFTDVVNNIVIDDANASRVGTWTAVKTFTATTTSPTFVGDGSGTDTNSFGTNYYTKTQGTGTSYIQFNPFVEVPGDYNIYQWHPNRTDASASLPFVISYYGGTATNQVNQTTNSGGWSLVGKYPFNTGTNGTVRIYDNFPEAGAVALVDGLKMVFVTPASVPTAPSALTATAVSGSQINLAWTDNSINESSFVVRQSTISGGPYSVVTNVAPNATTCSINNLNADTTYYFVVAATNYLGVSGNSAQANAKTFAVGGTAPAITQQPQNQTVNVSSTATFSVTATGLSLGYQWRFNASSIAGATASSFTKTNAQTSDSGNYSVVITNAYGSTTSTNATLMVVTVPPSITAQPQNTTNNAGTIANFSVTVTGTAPYVYQWKKDGSVLNNGGNVSGATSSSLTLTSVSSSDAAIYTVVITNTAGSATSSNATLSVNSVPSITSQPTSQTNGSGSTATFSVAATGSLPLSYQWKKDGTNLNNGGNILGANAASLTVNSISQSDIANYNVVVTNNFGAASSSAAALIVIDPPSINSQPSSRTNAAGTLATFTVGATGSSLSYQWLKGGAALVNGGNVSGANTATLNLASVTQSDATNYSVIVSNVAGTATSLTVSLSVITPPSLSSQPQSQTVSVGANVTFLVSASGTAPLSYRWRFNGATIAGATSSSYTRNTVQTNDGGNYSVVVTNGAGSVTSSNAVLTVNVGLTQITSVSNIWSIAAGSRSYVAVTNTERGIAINTISNHVLIVSRATNATGSIVAVDANTGSELGLTLNVPTGIIAGGTLPLNKVAVTTDGVIYAANVTTATSAPLRIYRWRNYSDTPVVAYSGLPDGGTTPRWGDSFALRGTGAGTQLIVAGSASTKAIIFTTSDGTNFSPTVITPSPAIVGGAFSKGLFFGAGNTFYSKNRTATIATNFLFDLGTGTATVNFLVPGLDANMIAIGVDNTHSLLTGVLDDATTNNSGHLLKTYDISNPSSPTLIASSSFPTFGSGTNSGLNTPNFAAHVDTDGSKIVGLDTQNGILASQLFVQSSPQILSQPQDQSTPQGQAAVFAVTASGATPLIYQWKKDGVPLSNSGKVSGATNASLTISNVSPTDEADYAVIISNSIGAVESAPATLSVIVVPAITTEPDAQTANAGASATFTAFASGTSPLSYQWKKGTTLLTNGVNVFGATSSNLFLANLTQSDAGDYSLFVTNAAGQASSLAAHLTIIDPPVIIINPIAKTVAAGATVSFNSAASGSNIGYQWRKNGIGISNGDNIFGATTTTLTVTGVSQSDVADYSLQVTNSAGSSSSSIAHLTVIDPPLITSQPTSRTNNFNTTATFSVSASGQNLTYRWNKNAAPLSDGANISGTTSASLTIANVTQTDAADYSVTITNIAGHQDSSSAHLTVISPPVITVQPIDFTTNTGAMATFSVAASSSAPLFYQWKKNNLSLSESAQLSGTTNAVLTIASVSPSDVGDYSVLVSNSAGSTNSGSGHLAILTAPAITIAPLDQTKGLGSNAVFHVIASGSGPLSYQWQKDGTNLISSGRIVGATSSSLTIAGASYEDEGSYSVAVTNSAGSIASEQVMLNVVSIPILTLAPLGQTNTSGSTISFEVTASGENLTYQWRKNGLDLTDDATDSGRLSGAKTSILTILASDSTDSGTYNVLIRNEAGTLVSSSANLVIQQAPAILTQPISRTNAANTVATFSVTVTGNSLVYQWRKDGLPLVNNTQIAGASTASLTVKGLTSLNNGDYSVVVSNSVGITASATAHLTVIAIPAITGQPLSRTNIANSIATFTVLANGVGLQYQWKKSGIALNDNYYISGATSATLTITGVLAGDSGAYSVAVSNAVGSVASKTANLKVVVPPTITSQPQNRTNLSGTTATFSVVCSGTTPLVYQWKKDGTILVNGPGISGANSATLALSGVTIGSAGSYSVDVNNFAGLSVSAPSTLTVLDGISILAQPSNVTNTVGSTATFNVQVSGTEPSYHWRKGTNTLVDGGNIFGATTDTLTIANAQFLDSGEFSVVVSNALSKQISGIASLTISSTPILLSQPVEQRVAYNGNATFTVQVTGTAPMGYQWKKNGTNLITGGKIVGATSSSLTVVGAINSDEGDYTVTVSNPVDSVSSTAAPLTIVPLIAILKPTVNATVVSGTTNVTGTASDHDGLTQVLYSWNSGPFVLASGTTNWSTPLLSFAAGTNTIVVKGINSVGRESQMASRSFFYPVVAHLTLITNGIGTLMPNLAAQTVYVGRKYTIAAVPGIGQLHSNWTGTYSTNVKTLTFVMQTNVTLTANFVTNLFIPRAGTYTGLLFETNEVTHESSGLFQFVLGTAGTYSGKFYLGGVNRSITGVFDLSGKSHFVYNGSPKVTFDLDLNTANGITDRVSGSASSALWNATVDGDRVIYSASNPTTQAGKYLVSLAGSSDGTMTPGGDGYVAINVTTNGAVSVSGSLSDGTLLMQSTFISKDGQIPLYIPLYATKGSVLGWLTVTNRGGSGVEGNVSWIKKSGTSATSYYASGFTNDLLAIGSIFSLTNGFPGLDLTNGVAILSGGDLTRSITNALSLSLDNVITVALGQPDSLLLTLATNSGVLSGTFFDRTTGTKVSIKGILLQQQNKALGYFLSPPTHVTGSFLIDSN
jgi:hypothetical protein